MSEPGTYVEKNFKRDTNYITTRITTDARDGFPVEAGRYRLVVARACPWANRAIIVRRLLGLEDALSMGICGPTHDRRSWTFDLDPGGLDPVLQIPRIQDAYFTRDPEYPRGITVPAIVDVPTGAVVTNDFKQITVDLETQWRDLHREGAPDLYPEALADEIESVSELIEMPALWGYARDLFQTPGFGDTVDFTHIKRHYYVVHTDVNPTGVVPLGPALENWATPHGREELGGSPFGEGTPPGPPREVVPAAHNPVLGLLAG